MPTTTYINVAKCLRVYQYRDLHGTCFQIPPGACAKVASDMGLGGGLHRVLRFPLSVTTGQTRISRNTAENVRKKRNSKCCMLWYKHVPLSSSHQRLINGADDVFTPGALLHICLIVLGHHTTMQTEVVSICNGHSLLLFGAIQCSYPSTNNRLYTSLRASILAI